MSRNKIDIRTLADMATAISHYEALAGYFSQLDPAQKATLDPAWDRAYASAKHMDHNSFEIWQDINFHIISQMWGSTACGWGGMGGAMMTKAYTMIIENHQNKLAFVYWHGKLAYIVDTDEKWETYVKRGYQGLPSLHSLPTQLTVVYIGNNRRI
jgi:hypothetical protein